MMNWEPEKDQAEMKSLNEDAISVGGFNGWGLSCVASSSQFATAPFAQTARRYAIGRYCWT